MDPARRKRLTLVACILGSSIAFVDTTVVNVALIEQPLHVGMGVAAGLLALGGLTSLAGIRNPGRRTGLDPASTAAVL